MGKTITVLPSAATSRAADAMVFMDENGIVTFVNAAAERLWGLSAPAMIGRDARVVFPAGLRFDPGRLWIVEDMVGTDRQVVIAHPDGSNAFALVRVAQVQHAGKSGYAAVVQRLPGPAGAAGHMGILSLVAEKTDRGVVVTDAQRRIVYTNRAFQEMLGYAEGEADGRPLSDLLASGKGAAELAARIDHGIQHRVPFPEDIPLRGASGNEVWVSAIVTPVLSQATGALEHVVAVLADITHTRLMEDLQRQVLAALAADAPARDILELLCRKVEGLAPGVLCTILGVTADDRLTVLAAPSLPAAFSDAVEGLRIGPKCGSCGTSAFRGEAVMVEDIASSPLWEDFRHLVLPAGIKGCWSLPAKLRSGKVAATFAFYFPGPPFAAPWLEGVVSLCSDLCALVLERSEARDRIATLASIDTLTGLSNRGRLLESLSDLIAEAGERDEPLAVLMLDVDHFKDVNDTLGHSTGDALLVEMARRLKAQLRTGDAVGRTGGDEFAVLVHDCGAEEAARIARRLIDYMAAPIPAQKLHLTMSASVGIALYPQHGASAETLLQHADTAMHEAKRKDRGRFQFFTEDLNKRAEDRLVLSVALRKALQNHALRLVYQPQVTLSGGALHGVEALARWSDPVHGEVPAPRFIALAEEYGFIDTIDRWAVEEVCAQMARWRAEGLAVPHVSVNLSPLSFRTGEIVGVISQALKQHRLAPNDLRIEITERVTMDQNPNSFAIARSIDALGVRIAMDDFGTGYSSLSALSHLPIAELKIDRSFMLSIEQDKNALALATAVILIGQSLGMTVVAEGVETAAQADLLRGLGCHAAQGYLFARPLEAADVAGWLSTPLHPAGPDGAGS
ncbi:UNVERIFIED_ORG: diguanylate cyclase (GGDEF)-like protein/PAS domain S-box-containing protein [Xanthobacter viscosus]|jgi:diguanylate cyclase (GGDEF)-like protein/PAS domain S-box-containing protein|uniref:EAL domain-containing protein n=1 Tax=Xanthobacter autotrophicus TaxID=280 RepID=A0A6C1KUA1_XANAU|nr:EAL domain-containing protein [Xanthobacter autotrophicus]TLX42653.1 EAL domain-containing protein [Xanthobacter autotrophicus]